MWNVYKNSGHSSVLGGHKIKPSWRVLPDCTCSRRAMEGSKEELLRELINTACKSISPSCFSVGVSRRSFSQGLLRRGDIGPKGKSKPRSRHSTQMILISNSNEIQRKSRANGSIVSRLSQRVSLSVAIDSSALVGHLFTLSQFLFLFLFTLSLYLFTELLI